MMAVSRVQADLHGTTGSIHDMPYTINCTSLLCFELSLSPAFFLSLPKEIVLNSFLRTRIEGVVVRAVRG